MFETLDRLRAIGLTPALINHFHAHIDTPTQRCAVGPIDSQPTRLLRVTQVQRETVAVHNGDGEFQARLLPALRHQLADEAGAIAVGDWVLAHADSTGACWVHQRLPPLNQLARRLHDGRDKVSRVVIVSNVDTALLVMGLDADFNLRRLERFVALVQMAQVTPLVVLSKSDLCPDPAERLAAVQAVLPAGAAVVAVNALDPTCGPVLHAWTSTGQTLVLLGSSGAGKSTLTNTLMGHSLALTGANRQGDGRGRHTTTQRSLYCMPGGACVIDTPGLRTLRLDGDAAELRHVFTDIASLAPQCHFRNCRHESEPGCAVRDAVDAPRLRSWNKLLREAQRDSLTALQRKEQVQVWKQRGRNARIRAQGKRGDG